jgi:hypothetical protein
MVVSGEDTEAAVAQGLTPRCTSMFLNCTAGRYINHDCEREWSKSNCIYGMSLLLM